MRALILFTIVTAALAGPAGRREEGVCVTQCSNEQKFTYETGRSYLYQYEAETITGIEGTFDDAATLKVKASAHIQPVSPCEFVLSLSDVQLEGSSKSSEFSQAVEQRPLKFSFDNGVVGHICGGSDEETWVLNFKKGVLSTFQNSMTHLEHKETVVETDISGRCETVYSTRKEDTVIFIQKEKVPSSCTRSGQTLAKLSSFGYDADTILRGFLPITSNQMCKQEISDDLIKRSRCDETHLFRPFSKEGKGAYTKTSTSLTYKTSEVAQPIFVAETLEKLDLLFTDSDQPSETEIAENILMRLETVSTRGVTKEVPALFSELVSSLRELSFTEIDYLFTKYQNNDVRQFLVDALPLVGTAGSMASVGKLMNSGFFSEEEQSVWFTGLAFIENPTWDMFEALLPIVKDIEDNKHFLGVSSLIHNYCKKDSDCHNVRVILDIVRVFQSNINNACYTSSQEEEKQMLFALKALGNAGVWADLGESLRRCYNQEDNSMEIRVTAIQAYRRVPCGLDRSALLDLFKRTDIDSELRIAAYLEVMNCPTKELLDVLRVRLATEEVDQVGSFIWTHLSNLQETAAIDKQHIRQLVGLESLQKKFNTNALKFSRNFESSFYLEEQQVGGSTEANVIFSSKSFLPRSAMMNLTVDVFGQAVNLFEVGGRMEGFETYIEKFFGPEGYYPDETMAEIISNLKEANKGGETDPKGSYYMKMFGNELMYNNFKGLESFGSDMKMENVMDFVMSLTTGDGINYRKNYNLINTEYNFPTITGFPINMKLNGSASVDLKLEGDFNMKGLSSFDINGKFQPSAALRIDSSMAVDAFVTKSGMKMVSTLHTSTHIDGKIAIEGGKLVDINFKVPNEKLEIYDYSREFFKMEDNTNILLEPKDLEEYNVCFPPIFRSLALDICYERKYSSLGDDTKPYFPLNGPVKTHLYLKKTDTQDAYIFRFNRNSNKFYFLVDMPGSSNSKKWMLDVEREAETLAIDIVTPHGDFNGKGVVKFGNGGIKSSFNINNYEGVFEFTKSSENTIKHHFITYLKDGSGYLLNFNSNLARNRVDRTISGDLQLDGTRVPRAKVDFNFERRSDHVQVIVHADTKPLQASVEGYVRKSEGYYSYKLDVSSTVVNYKPITFNTSGRYMRKTEGGVTTVTTSVVCKQFGLELDSEIKVHKTKIENKGSLKFGYLRIPDTTWDQSVGSTNLSDGAVEYHIRNLSSLKNMHTLLFDKKITIKQGFYESTGTIEYNGRTIHSHELSLKNREEYQLNINLHLGETPYALQCAFTTVAPGFYKVLGSQTIGSKVDKLEGTFQNLSTSGKFDVKLEGNVDFFGTNYRVESSVLATPSEFAFKGKMNCDGHMCHLTIKASHTQIEFDTNFFKTVSAVAKLSTESEKRFDLDVKYENYDPIEATFAYSQSKIEGSFKMSDTELGFMAKLQDNGFEVKTQWTPTDIINVKASYSYGPNNYFATLSLDTPFTGFEKQDARLDFKITRNEYGGQFVANWQNIHHMSIVFGTNLETGLHTKFDANVKLTSTLDNFERIEFTVKYARTNWIVNGKFDAQLNNKVIVGRLNAMPTESGYKVALDFNSPFFQNIEYNFEYGITRTNIFALDKFVWGDKTSKIVLKGDISDLSNITGSLVVSAIYLPNINVDVAIKTSDTVKTINFIGMVNDKKIYLLGKSEIEQSNSDVIRNMKLKLTVPSGKVYTLNLIHKTQDSNQFFTTINYTPIFIGDEYIKINIEGKFESCSDCYLNAKISGPYAIQLKVAHKIDNNQLSTKFSSTFNDMHFGFDIKGVVEDIQNFLGTFEINTTSSSMLLNNIHIKVQRDIKAEERNTLLNITKDNFSAKIYHSILFQNVWNWHDTLVVNDIYSLKTSLEKIRNVINSKVQYTWRENIVEAFVEIRETDKIEVDATFASPWTSLLKLSMTRKRIGDNIIGTWKFNYGHNREFETIIDYNINYNSDYTYKLSMFYQEYKWTPITFEYTFDNKMKPKDMNLKLEVNDLFSLSGKFNLDVAASDMKILVNSDHFAHPIKIIGSYSLLDKTYQLNINVENMNYKINSENRKGQIFLSHLYIPYLMSRSDVFEMSLEYNLRSKPFDVNLYTKTNYGLRWDHSAIYNDGKFDYSFKSTDEKTQRRPVTHNLTARWKKENSQTFVDINANFDEESWIAEGASLSLNSNFKTEKSMFVKGHFGKFKLNGELKKNDSDFYDFTITVKDENFNGELKNAGNVLNGSVSYDNSDEMSKFVLTRLPKEIKFELTHSKSQQIKANLSFNYMFGEKKEINLNTKRDEREISFHASVDGNIPIKFQLDLSDTNSSFQTASIIAVISKTGVNMHGSCNDKTFNFDLKNSLESSTKGEIKLDMSSNIPNWSSYSTNLSYLLQNKSYNFKCIVKTESITREYSFKLKYDNNAFQIVTRTPVKGYEKIDVEGSYKFNNNRLETSFNINDNKIYFEGNVDFKTDVPTVNISIKTPFEYAKTIDMAISGQYVSRNKKFNISCKINEITHSVSFFTDLTKVSGSANINLELPMLESSSFKLAKFDLTYDLTKSIKTVKFEVAKNNIDYNYYLKAKFENNEFHFDLQTPFEEAKHIHADGIYKENTSNNKYSASGSFSKNNFIYNFNGNFAITEDGFEMEGSTPFNNFETFRVYGTVENNKISLTFKKQGDLFIEKTISVEYQLEDGIAFFKVNTPFEILSYFAIGFDVKNDGQTLEGTTYIHKNSEKLNMKGKFMISYEKSYLGFQIDVPLRDEKHGFEVYYDIESSVKNVGASFNFKDWSKKCNIEMYFASNELDKAFVRMTSSYPGYENMGIEYKYIINYDEKEANILLKTYINEETFAFGFENIFRSNHFLVKIMTPFTDYKINKIEGLFDMENREGRMIMVGGPYHFEISTCLKRNNINFMLKAPFLTPSEISGKYKFDRETKKIFFKIVVDEPIIDFNGSFNPCNPKVDIKLKSPFGNYVSEFIGFYDIISPEKKIEAELNVNSIIYKIASSYELSENRASVKFNLVSPINNWTDVRFIAAYNLEDNDKALIITYGRTGDKDLINLRGRIVDDEIQFEVQLPFDKTNNFKTVTSLNRAKRSLDFRMMNDQNDASIVANFNSLKMKVKTPYDQVKEANLEMTKSKKGVFKLSYKRNDRFLTIDSVPENKGVSVTVSAALPGWLPLLTHGLLEEGELWEYVTYKKTIGDITYNGKGKFGPDRGDYEYSSATPFPKMKGVTGSLEYNTRKGKYKFAAKSSSSDAHITVAVERGSFSVDLLTPYERHENTIIKGSVTPFKSQLTMSSRFPAFRTVSLSHSIQLGNPKISIKALYERNDVKRFEVDMEADQSRKTLHFMIMALALGNKSMLHIHREQLQKLMVEYTRNENTFKIDATGSGPQLLKNGRIDFTVDNSFREVPVHVVGNIQIDREASPRKIIMELVYPSSKKYSGHLNYNADLKDLSHGNFTLRIVTPTKDMRSWKNISGDWKLENGKLIANYKRGDEKSIKLNATIDQLDKGKIQFESNIFFPMNTYGLTWNLIKRGNKRNYYIKAQRGDYFIEMAFKGKIVGAGDVNVEGLFQASRFMKNTLKYKLQWKKSGNELTGEGSFEIGNRKGAHKLIYFRRNAANRAAQFKWEAKTNIKNFKKINLNGEYSLKDKNVDVSLSWDADNMFIKGKLIDYSVATSSNKVEFRLPTFGSGIKDGELTFTHDFANKLDKTIKITGTVGGKPFTYNIHWTRNASFTVLNLEVDINSQFFNSVVKATYNYDISNLRDARAHLVYDRNNKHKVEMKWARTRTETKISNEMELTTSFGFLPKASSTFHADYSSGLKVDAALEWKDKAIRFDLNVGKSKTTAHFTSPFRKYSDVSATLEYSMKPKTKTVTLNYKRGDREVKLNAEVNTPTNKKGSLKVVLTTPFKAVRNLNIDGTWKKGNLKAKYKRNDVVVDFNGNAEIKADKSSLNIQFTLPSGKLVSLGFSYDATKFIEGKGKKPTNLLSFDLNVDGKMIKTEIKGYRNSDKIYLDVSGTSSFEKARTFSILLDSELRVETSREGKLVIKVNDFSWKQTNKFEKRKDGFYIRTNVESSLTKLPGLVFGIGREGDFCILTAGLGTEEAVREVTISVKGKNGFKNGFSGKFDVPRFNLNDVNYDVTYAFKGNNIVNVDVKAGKKTEVNIIYNSDGLKSRWNTPMTGLHSLRMRRSISDDHFEADIGFDNYGFTLIGGLNNNSFQKGVKLEGDIFGKPVNVEVFLTSAGIFNAEGKLLVQIPFLGLDKYGGSFKTKTEGKLYSGDLNFKLINKYTGSFDIELNNDKLLQKGKASFNVNDELYKFDGKFDRTGESYDITLSFENPLAPIEVTGSVRKLSGNAYSGNLEFQARGNVYTTKFEYARSVGNIKFDLDLVTPKSSFVHKLKFMWNKENNVRSVKFVLNQRNILMNYYFDLSPFFVKLDSTMYLSDVSTHKFGFEFNKELKNGVLYFKFRSDSDHIFKIKGNYGNENSATLTVTSKFVPFTSLSVIVPDEHNIKINLITVRGEYSAVVSKTCDNSIKNVIFQLDVKIPGDKDLYRFDVTYLNEDKFEIGFDLKRGEEVISNFNAALDMSQGFYLALKIQHNNSPHTIYIDYKDFANTFVASATSMYIPTGAIKIEGNIDAASPLKFEGKAAYADAVQSFSSYFKADIESPQEKEFLFELNTPIVGYEHIHVEVAFSNKDITSVKFYMEPFHLDLNAFYGFENSVIKTGLKAQTGLDNWKNLGFDAFIPLNTFAPKLSATFGEKSYSIEAEFENTINTGILNGKAMLFNSTNFETKSYEFGTNYSKIAPYQYGYHVDFDHGDYDIKRKFGIMIDSSLFSLFNPRATFLS